MLNRREVLAALLLFFGVRLRGGESSVKLPEVRWTYIWHCACVSNIPSLYRYSPFYRGVLIFLDGEPVKDCFAAFECGDNGLVVVGAQNVSGEMYTDWATSDVATEVLRGRVEIQIPEGIGDFWKHQKALGLQSFGCE